jgi:hypothetical protein
MEERKNSSDEEMLRKIGGSDRATPLRHSKRGRVVKDAEVFVVTRSAMSKQSDCCCPPARVSFLRRASASVTDVGAAGAPARFTHAGRHGQYNGTHIVYSARVCAEPLPAAGRACGRRGQYICTRIRSHNQLLAAHAGRR